MKCYCTSEEIAATVAFLASTGGYTTGQNIRVDGGADSLSVVPAKTDAEYVGDWADVLCSLG